METLDRSSGQGGLHDGAGTDSPSSTSKGSGTMTAVPEFEFRTSSACTYNNNDPRCVEVATNVPGKVAVRNSATGHTVEFTAAEWAAFLPGAKLGEFDVTA